MPFQDIAKIKTNKKIIKKDEIQIEDFKSRPILNFVFVQKLLAKNVHIKLVCVQI